jgi:transposase
MQHADRSRSDPHPKSIDELISPDHQVRLVWELVGELDMNPLYARIKAVEGHPGRPAIDPLILTALWLYATIEGIAGARELDRRCRDCDPFKWLCGGVKVNYHTLSDFRTDHGDWLQGQVVHIVAVLRKEGLVDLNQVGQDGMRVRASAGSGSFKRQPKLDEFLQEAQQQWDQLQQEFEQNPPELNARSRAARKRAARERLERLNRAKEECQQLAESREKRKKGDGETARASMTDPEAHKMKMADGGYRPAYNVQFATTLDTLVIIGVDVINSGSDGGQMEPMVQQIEAQQDTLPGEYYTDGGFSTKDDIEDVEQRGVTVYTPVKEADKQKREGKDPYAPRSGEGPQLTAWRQRMGTEEAKAKYKQRAKCEWSNAQCRNHNLWQFTVRGLRKAKAVALWHALVQNLLRMVTLRAEHAAATA